mgnify:CR=1 FL=1
MPQKDDKLLQDLIKKYARLFLKLAISHGVPCDDAEDIVMDAFWSFYDSEYYGKLSESETRMLMARIVKNKCIDRYRKYKAEEELTLWKDIGDVFGVQAPSQYDPERQVIAEDSYRRIRNVIENLKPTWRDVAVMYFLEERTYAEISKALGVSEEVCRARVSRARKFLEGKLKEFRDDS